MQILLQKKVFGEVRHPGERVWAKGRETYELVFCYLFQLTPAQPALLRSVCPRKDLPPRLTPSLTSGLGWPVTSSPAMRMNIVDFPGHLVNHGMQSRQEHSIISILEHYSPHFHSQFFFFFLFFSFLHFASKHPAQMNSCSFHTLFFHFHNHSTQLFRFRSCFAPASPTSLCPLAFE